MKDDAERAMALLERLPKTPGGDVLAWNSVVNLLIALGRYHEAIRYRRHFSKRLRDSRELLPQLYGLVLLNLAEAQYNLGRWKRAQQLMLALRGSGKMSDRLNHTGGYAQLAWIDVHAGNGKAALETLAQCDESALPVNYRAELHFTFAAAHLANQDVPKARAALDLARARLIRPSSARNLLFLEARCAFAEGDFKQAASLCEQAANHSFKTQGGDGLLLWGDACEKLGDSAAAARAWQLAIDRDGESESAMLARQRLESAARKSA